MTSETKKEEVSNNITLDEYSTFQYMLSPPTATKAIVDQTTSFVFYNCPYEKGKMKAEHTIVHGTVTSINYYCCSLVLLPSHILGMSKWISSVDYQSKKTKFQCGDTLRRFQYSFYWGLLKVDTRHLCVEDIANNDTKHAKKFRLVESIICPVSPWVIVNAVFLLVAICLTYLVKLNGLFVNESFVILVASVLAMFHLILILSGVHQAHTL